MRAEEHYRKALEWLHAPQVTNRNIQQRDLRQAYLGLAEVCADRHDFAGAQEALRRLLDVPGKPAIRRDVQHRLWTLCRLTDGFDAMRKRVRQTAAAADSTPACRVDVQFQIAYSYIYERRYEDARREFAKLLAMPDSTPAHQAEARLYVAHTFFVARQYAKARPQYERVAQGADEAGTDAFAATARARIKAIDALSGASAKSRR